MPKRLNIVAAVCALAALAGTSAVAYGLTGPASPPQSSVSRLSPAMTAATSTVAVPAVQAAIAAGFPLFRVKPPTAMPEPLATQLASPTRFGRNAALARAIATPYGTGWVIPGDGYLCLAVPDPVSGYGESCTSVAVAAEQGLWLRLHGGRADGKALDTLVLPNATKVAETSRSQATTLSPTSDGVVSQLTDADAPPRLVAAR
jgi:hypothetical protein